MKTSPLPRSCTTSSRTVAARPCFGKFVAVLANASLDIVDGCTDTDLDPKPPWLQRKKDYIAHLRTADADTRLVSAADKLHNVRSIVAAYREIGDRVWERFHGKRDGTLWYYRELLDEFRRKRTNPLLSQLERAVIELEAVVTAAK